MNQRYDQRERAGNRLTVESAERLDLLFRRYNKRVVGYLVRLTGNPDLAQDIASETWLQVAHALPRITNDDHLFPYLKRAARRGIGHYYRVRRNQEKPLDWSDAVSVMVLPAVAPADDEVLALAELTPSQACVMKLAAQGLSQGAIASRLRRSPGAVYSHLHRGARKLRAQVEDRPPLPTRPAPHERDGRQDSPVPGRPHSWSADTDNMPARTPAKSPRPGAVLALAG